MAGNRTLKLSILADVDNLKKGLDQADKDVQSFGSKLGDWSKKAGIAFAVAGAAAAAYAGKLAIDGVKAAIEDEAAQKRLATSLQNVTGATEAQIAATEKYITKTSLAFGVTDDQLRPSLDRLVRSTKSVEEAQKLQALALDISAGSGKSLQAVSEALARAHDGNFAALKKLGVSIDESIIKSKNFDAATAALANTFQGQASAQAETFEGKLNRLKIGFDEAKEGIGSLILDGLTPMVNGIVKNVLPVVTEFINSIGGNEGLKTVFSDFVDGAKKIFIPIFEGLKNAFNNIKNAVIQNKDEFQALFDFLKKYVAPFLGGALKIAIEAIGVAISTVVNVLGTFIGLIDSAFEKLKRLIDLIKNNPLTRGIGNLFGNTSAPTVPNNVGNPNIRNTSAPVNNITVNGAVDPISTARQIANILNIEATQSGTFRTLGGNLAYQA